MKKILCHCEDGIISKLIEYREKHGKCALAVVSAFAAAFVLGGITGYIVGA